MVQFITDEMAVFLVVDLNEYFWTYAVPTVEQMPPLAKLILVGNRMCYGGSSELRYRLRAVDQRQYSSSSTPQIALKLSLPSMVRMERLGRQECERVGCKGRDYWEERRPILGAELLRLLSKNKRQNTFRSISLKADTEEQNQFIVKRTQDRHFHVVEQDHQTTFSSFTPINHPISICPIYFLPSNLFLITLPNLNPMGSEGSLCSSTARSLETDVTNTIEFDGTRFILPSTMNFQKQATVQKVESAAKSFSQQNKVSAFFLPLITRMIAFRHEKLFLAVFGRLQREQREQFLNELNQIQHDLMDSFYHHYFQREKGKNLMRKSLKNQQLMPPKLFHVGLTPAKGTATGNAEGEIGRQMLKAGKGSLWCIVVAVVFMLAGSSSRFNLQDKFLASINLYQRVTILDLLFWRLKRNGANKTTTKIAVICSHSNQERVKQYIQERKFYGFIQQNIKFLVSFALPIFDAQGEYCYSKEMKLIKRASGTANAAEQAYTNGLFEAWKDAGAELVYFSGGENLLENPGDPNFIGLMAQEQRKAGVKCVKSQFFGELMPRYFEAGGALKVLQSSTFEQLPSGTLEKLPIPMNSLAFRLDALLKLTQDYSTNISLAGNYQVLKLEAEVFNFSTQSPEKVLCFNFEKDIRYLPTCVKDPLLYRVHRPEEYAPILSKSGEYSFSEAVKFYQERLEKQFFQLSG